MWKFCRKAKFRAIRVNCAFQQNLHSRKLGKINTFYAVKVKYEAILHINSLNTGFKDETPVFRWLNQCLITRKSKHGLMTPLNPGIVLISPNLGFRWIPRKYSVYSEDWKKQEATESKDLV